MHESTDGFSIVLMNKNSNLCYIFLQPSQDATSFLKPFQEATSCSEGIQSSGTFAIALMNNNAQSNFLNSCNVFPYRLAIRLQGDIDARNFPSHGALNFNVRML